MSNHDPLCPQREIGYLLTACAYCEVISDVRADERAAIMSRIKQDMTVDREMWTTLARSFSAESIRADERERIAHAIEAAHRTAPNCGPCAYEHATQIARNGGRDD